MTALNDTKLTHENKGYIASNKKAYSQILKIIKKAADGK